MIIPFDTMPDTVLDRFNGGDGSFVAKMFYDGKCKILRGLLRPGCSIGMHTHAANSEAIYVLSGVGTMLFDDTVETLRPGDCHYCPQGHSHSFRNEGSEDLVFFAVVPEHGA